MIPMKTARILWILLFVSVLLDVQAQKNNTIWATMKHFSGTWTGSGTGESGNGAYTRTYQWVLGNNYLEVRNKSLYPPAANKPGSTHEDIGYISYDQQRAKFILRQFHIEGFVNTYVLDSLSADGRLIVFASEHIENISKGWRARETYQIVDENTFTEVFELAEPGGDFFEYSRVTLRRE